MIFGYLGINYKNADMQVRDKIAFTDNRKADFFQKTAEKGIRQCLILATCNRSEVFYLYQDEEEKNGITEVYKETFPDIQAGDYMQELTGKEAMEYLFRISAGLESLVLGEDQILGQVKDALEFSRTMGFSGKELNKIVRDAVTCAKKIKTELKMSEHPLSVSYIGIQKVNEICGIAGKTILVIGTGKTSQLAMKYLCEYENTRMIVCNRSYEKATLLKAEFPEIELVSFDDRYKFLEQADIVVSATSSPHRVIQREKLLSDQPRVFLDFASPRDIDETVLEIPGVQLINLDTMQDIARQNREERELLIEKSRRMIDSALDETLEWISVSKMDNTIETLQQRCAEIVNDSYSYLSRKMELSAREQKLLKKVLNASLQRLLHEPIQELKSLDNPEDQEKYQQLVKELFQIKE